ncbi:hypothetical protein WJX74_003137 [Apatococcus lobatus]|uniref:Uncharacterized protein n=1 Tax=Apatococcus lobatus TaxID=904363 RepID=A0AAW1RI93_9CHLO
MITALQLEVELLQPACGFSAEPRASQGPDENSCSFVRAVILPEAALAPHYTAQVQRGQARRASACPSSAGCLAFHVRRWNTDIRLRPQCKLTQQPSEAQV